MSQALAAGDFDPERVAVTARAQLSVDARRAPAVELPTDIEQRFGHLPARGAPSLADYDQLLIAAGGTR